MAQTTDIELVPAAPDRVDLGAGRLWGATNIGPGAGCGAQAIALCPFCDFALEPCPDCEPARLWCPACDLHPAALLAD